MRRCLRRRFFRWRRAGALRPPYRRRLARHPLRTIRRRRGPAENRSKRRRRASGWSRRCDRPRTGDGRGSAERAARRRVSHDSARIAAPLERRRRACRGTPRLSSCRPAERGNTRRARGASPRAPRRSTNHAPRLARLDRQSSWRARRTSSVTGQIARLDRQPTWRAKQITSFDREIARLDLFPASRAIDRSTFDRRPAWLAISFAYGEVLSASDEILLSRDDVSLGRLAVRRRALDVRRSGFEVSFACDEAFSVRDAVVVPRQDVPWRDATRKSTRALALFFRNRPSSGTLLIEGTKRRMVRCRVALVSPHPTWSIEHDLDK